MLSLLRLRLSAEAVLDDLTSHSAGVGFLTVVAATGVLGAQVILIGHEFAIAVVLLAVAVVLWLALTYTIFTALTIKGEKPSLPRGSAAPGCWRSSPPSRSRCWPACSRRHWGDRRLTPSSSPCRCGSGGMLYIWIISLIFYRYTFFRFSPATWPRPTGSTWVRWRSRRWPARCWSKTAPSPPTPVPAVAAAFLKGVTVFYWATGPGGSRSSLILAVWRYGYRRLPFDYDPLYWGAVFPLGMYAVATDRMAEALKPEFLEPLPQIFLGLALAAWLLTFLGLLRGLQRTLFARRGVAGLEERG